jgi:hypothetical protein
MANRSRLGRRRSDITAALPHPFEAADDPGLAAFAAGGLGGQFGSSPASAAWTTSTFIRESRCKLCEKPREDPIHEVEE